MDTYIGFDSAWTDNPKKPGAICALQVEGDAVVAFRKPEPATFDQALGFIQSVRSPTGCTLLALDQPTIVPNLTGMRPVERTAASLVSWLGGGVQPSHRGKVGMFCNASPIWRFLDELGAAEDPAAAAVADSGLHLIEVFPAIALPSIACAFFGRKLAPRYNPERRKTFRFKDWRRVGDAVEKEFATLKLSPPAVWCAQAAALEGPSKADQDRLDAMICLLVALRWRLRPRSESIMLGCLQSGYMVLPASAQVRDKLIAPARKNGVPIDCRVPA